LFMDASVQVTSTRHLGTSMPSRGRPPHHYQPLERKRCRDHTTTRISA
jgi:hypothetical protein